MSLLVGPHPHSLSLAGFAAPSGRRRRFSLPLGLAVLAVTVPAAQTSPRQASSPAARAPRTAASTAFSVPVVYRTLPNGL
ncbi:MAG TPA: hypothetical protein VNZ26_19105, partial [Vicinamibacterales bacterium]|nr:hypothetical protein [Vicinamibacterales bacterium]